MPEVLYVDQEIIVAVKPAGVESQAARRFEPDMVSGLKKYLVMHRLCTPGREPYIGVIHRLDKPVSGVMVYARTKNAAAALSSQLQNGKMKKIYQAVVCGKPVEDVENYVDYLKKSVDGNVSYVVDGVENGGKRAELTCRVLKTGTFEDEGGGQLSLVEIHLKTGRHHQIRVQMAAHGHPVYGDAKYNPAFSDGAAFQGAEREKAQLALCAVSLSFVHPAAKKQMTFSVQPKSGIFTKFYQPDSE